MDTNLQTKFYSVEEMKRAYVSDTGGHYFDADTMKFFRCRIVEMRDHGSGPIIILRQVRNGLVSDTDNIYRVVQYRPGTEHRCECCGQRDQRGELETFDDEDFKTLPRARKFAKTVLVAQ